MADEYTTTSKSNPTREMPVVARFQADPESKRKNPSLPISTSAKLRLNPELPSPGDFKADHPTATKTVAPDSEEGRDFSLEKHSARTASKPEGLLCSPPLDVIREDFIHDDELFTLFEIPSSEAKTIPFQ
jgi:hypothetical protein